MEYCAHWVNLAVRLVVKKLWADAFIQLRPDSLRGQPPKLVLSLSKETRTRGGVGRGS